MPYIAPYLQLSEMQKERGNRAFNQQVGFSKDLSRGVLSLDEMLKEMEAKQAKAAQQKFENERLTSNDTFNKNIQGRQVSVSEGNLDLSKKKQEDELTKQKNAMEQQKIIDAASGSAQAQFLKGEPNVQVHEANIKRIWSEAAIPGLTEEQVGKWYYDNWNKAKQQSLKEREVQVKEDKVDKKKPIPVSSLNSMAKIRSNIGKIKGFIDRVKTTGGLDSGLQQELSEAIKSKAGASENVQRTELLRIVSSYIADISGKTVTDAEMKRLNEFLPTWKQNPKLLMAQVAGILNDRVKDYNSYVVELKKNPIFDMEGYEEIPEYDDTGNTSMEFSGPSGASEQVGDLAETGTSLLDEGAKFILEQLNSGQLKPPSKPTPPKPSGPKKKTPDEIREELRKMGL